MLFLYILSTISINLNGEYYLITKSSPNMKLISINKSVRFAQEKEIQNNDSKRLFTKLEFVPLDALGKNFKIKIGDGFLQRKDINTYGIITGSFNNKFTKWRIKERRNGDIRIKSYGKCLSLHTKVSGSNMYYVQAKICDRKDEKQRFRFIPALDQTEKKSSKRPEKRNSGGGYKESENKQTRSSGNNVFMIPTTLKQGDSTSNKQGGDSYTGNYNESDHSYHSEHSDPSDHNNHSDHNEYGRNNTEISHKNSDNYHDNSSSDSSESSDDSSSYDYRIRKPKKRHNSSDSDHEFMHEMKRFLLHLQMMNVVPNPPIHPTPEQKPFIPEKPPIQKKEPEKKPRYQDESMVFDPNSADKVPPKKIINCKTVKVE